MQEFLSGHIAEELAFYRIRSSVSECAKTEEGRARILCVEPTANAESIAHKKSFSKEWTVFLSSQRKDALSFFPTVKPLFMTLGKQGASLSLEQLHALGQFCNTCINVKKSIHEAKDSLSLVHLAEVCSSISDLQAAQNIIYSIIDKDGQLKDLPQLQEIRQHIRQAQHEIESAIKKYTSDPTLNSSLQSKVPALKSGRQLIALRSDRRGDIKGIVHEVSSSGQTVFIEPEEAVKANNDLVQEQYRLQAEIHKILIETTSQLSPFKSDFENAHEKILFLDETFAAAKWGLTVNGIFAEDCNEDTPLALIQARHPLLGKNAVPIDVVFMHGKRVLIITGPNTGGKTVTLKTIALFALMNQAGFPLPAKEGTRLPLFTSVFADIGDEQSIDQSLSTFAGHMKNLAQMLSYADRHSLILLDELGNGTDPQEGGAIAMAALDTLIEKQALILVTTHHGILKHYGFTQAQCINASVEFDSESMKPTYKLVMGTPGESHALDIARSSGLPQKVVDAAQKYMDGEQADISVLIKNLSQKHAELNALIEQQEQALNELEQKKLAVLEREADLKQEQLELSKEENRQSFAFLRETRSKLENLVRQLREGEITREKTLAVRHFINEVTEAVEKQETVIVQLEQEQQVLANGIKLSRAGTHKSSANKKTKKKLSNSEALAQASVPPQKKSKVKEKVLPSFCPGAAVQSISSRAKGTLIEETKPGLWSVQFGSVKMAVKQNDLKLLEETVIQTNAANIIIEAADHSGLSTEKPVFELRLMGMRCEQALKALEHQIDLCMIHSFKKFSVIHGKGNGVLQQAVHDYLSHAREIRDFMFAPPEDGGTGKTYVELY